MDNIGISTKENSYPKENISQPVRNPQEQSSQRMPQQTTAPPPPIGAGNSGNQSIPFTIQDDSAKHLEKKFCMECGKEMKINTKGEWFCPSCGYKLTLTPEEKRKLQLVDEKVNKSKASTFLAIIKILMMIAGAVLLIFIVKSFMDMLNGLSTIMG